MQWARPQAGEIVWIRGRRWRVAGVRAVGSVARIDAVAEATRRTFLIPFDRAIEGAPGSRPVRARRQRALAMLTALGGKACGARALPTVIHAGMAILPHQLEPALAVVSGARRVLIADEVGLGKTIQAGLIAAEVQRADPAARVLVMAPAALVPQWCDELRDRFAFNCRVADRGGLDAHARDQPAGDNPWRGSGLWIASIDFLKQPHVVSAVPARPWDLVVVDEAHAACGRSERHAVVDHLCQRARRVVLLSATPHSGDAERFERLLRIGRLDDEILVFRRVRSDLGLRSRRRVAWHGVSLSSAETQALAALTAFERAVLKATADGGRDEARLLLAVFRKRALSTMSALARSVDRRASCLALAPSGLAADGWTQTSLAFESTDEDDVASAEDLAGLRVQSGLLPDVERSWLKRLGHLARRAMNDERKIARLVRLLARTAEPAIVFTEFRDSLEVLADRLAIVRPLALLHGGMAPAERAESFRRFHSGDASLLLATDVAGQGVNLQQRCRWVIGLELPWNPARLEQRIGRVDRIGQQRPVHLTLLVARHESEAGLLSHLARRVAAARGPFGGTALVDVPPPEHAIRMSLIERVALPTAPNPAVPLCTAWRRSARSVARGAEVSRRCAARWQGPQFDGRPATTSMWRPRLDRASAGGTLLIFTVPLFDGSGSLLELALRAVHIGAAIPTQDTIGAASQAVLASLAPRARRLRRLTQSQLALLVDRERAIARAMRAHAPREAQPGLFDARELRSFEEAALTAAEIDRDCDLAIERLRRRVDIAIGRPRLELILRARS